MEIRAFVWIVTVGCLTDCVHTTYKRWTQNTRADNPHNWNKGRLPCGNEKMVIPDESPAIYLQFNGTISELVLPVTGELILGDNIAIGFTNTPDHGASCLGSDTEVDNSGLRVGAPEMWHPDISKMLTIATVEDCILFGESVDAFHCTRGSFLLFETGKDGDGDIKFNVTSPREWTDPMNWCTTDSETGDCSYPFKMDSEKIPCSFDDVIFPSKSSFFVDLGRSLDLQVNTLKIGINTFTTTSFQEFIQGAGIGNSMFPDAANGALSTVNIKRKACTDATGCVCGNNNEMTMKSICEIQSTRCEIPQCMNPLIPTGNCCPLCGAILMAEYGAGFKLANLMDALEKNIIARQNDVDPIQVAFSKTKSPQVQIVLTDPTGPHSKDIAQQIKTFIESDIKTGGLKYSVKRITLQESGVGTPAKQTGSATLGAGGIAGVVIGSVVIVSLLVIGFVYFYLRRSKSRPAEESQANTIQFWRNPRSRPAAEVAPSIEFRNINPVANVGFDNPLYGNEQAEFGKEVVLQPPQLEELGREQQATFDSSRGFDNPLYDNSGVAPSFYYDPTNSEVVIPPHSETSA